MSVANSIQMDSFYENLKDSKFNRVSLKKILKLKCVSKILNRYYNNEYCNLYHREKYIIIMNKIKTNPKMYMVDSNAEKYILFMFSVDPNFEALKIFGECNRVDDIKNKCEKQFGVYDKRLIIIEKYFVKYFVSEKQRKEIYEEIERRVFK